MTNNLLIVGNIAVETNFPQCLVKISLKTMFNEPLGANPMPACQLPLCGSKPGVAREKQP